MFDNPPYPVRERFETLPQVGQKDEQVQTELVINQEARLPATQYEMGWPGSKRYSPKKMEKSLMMNGLLRRSINIH